MGCQFWTLVFAGVQVRMAKYLYFFQKFLNGNMKFFNGDEILSISHILLNMIRRTGDYCCAELSHTKHTNIFALV